MPMWVSRLNGLRQFVNSAYHDFLGVSYADALNFDWRKALHPDDLGRILREQRAGEGSRRPFALEARYRRHDGQWRWLRSESQPRKAPSGEHIGFIGVAHDVTARKKPNAQLTELNETLERRIARSHQQLAASEALIQTFFQPLLGMPRCHRRRGDGHFRYAGSQSGDSAALREDPRGSDRPTVSSGVRAPNVRRKSRPHLDRVPSAQARPTDMSGPKAMP